jgi:hypothetical protein
MSVEDVQNGRAGGRHKFSFERREDRPRNEQ